jgi:hypothetical protein
LALAQVHVYVVARAPLRVGEQLEGGGDLLRRRRVRVRVRVRVRDWRAARRRRRSPKKEKELLRSEEDYKVDKRRIIKSPFPACCGRRKAIVTLIQEALAGRAAQSARLILILYLPQACQG